MKKLSTLLLILLSHFSFSQNLVPNPSFEIYDTCPYNLTQIQFATGWSSYSITPDYFNSCSPDTLVPSVSVPSNVWGFQYARTGNAYAGLITFNRVASNAREYIGVELNQSLSIGHKYFASFYISRAKSKTPGINIATNKMGMRLSTVAYSDNSPAPINNFAHVYTDSIITDTLNWIQVSGSFIADSSYHYLSIGNFFTDIQTSYISFDSLSANAYYYIDDVYLSSDSVNGISEYNNDFINVFPNPARDWIDVEGRGIFKLSFYNVIGKLCFSIDVLSSSLLNRVDVSNLSKGIYFLIMKTTKENIIQKLIIE